MMINSLRSGADTTNATKTASPAAPTPAAPTAAKPPVDEAQLKAAVQAANSAMATEQSGIEFSLDSTSGKTIVRVLDTQTNEVIRQMPSEEMLQIAKAIDRFQGRLLHQKA